MKLIYFRVKKYFWYYFHYGRSPMHIGLVWEAAKTEPLGACQYNFSMYIGGKYVFQCNNVILRNNHFSYFCLSRPIGTYLENLTHMHTYDVCN